MTMYGRKKAGLIRRQYSVLQLSRLYLLWWHICLWQVSDQAEIVMPVYFNRRVIIFLKIADIMETGMEVDAVDAIRKEDVFTVEDIYALADGERAELIDGKIYYMAPPNTLTR